MPQDKIRTLRSKKTWASRPTQPNLVTPSRLDLQSTEFQVSAKSPNQTMKIALNMASVPVVRAKTLTTYLKMISTSRLTSTSHRLSLSSVSVSQADRYKTTPGHQASLSSSRIRLQEDSQNSSFLHKSRRIARLRRIQICQLTSP